ncbi:hypothetical protein ACLQ24_08035 [Micromonospora sp. DT4]|uniref:hypothetical protein n=1 Tax=Micromonospora sp. DT4 TaxID=3393438 RepID=UPI003CF1B8DE
MTSHPYLKPACAVDDRAERLRLTYRGRAYSFDVSAEPGVRQAVELMNGRTSVEQIARTTGLDTASVGDLVGRLAETPLLLDGAEIVRGEGISGTEAYWRLEGQLWQWRSFDQPADRRPASDLEIEIAKGSAPVAAAKGFLLEICHQVSNAPTEIALAVANSPTKAVRDLFMEFYEEEHAHGDMLREALAHWLPADGIDAAVPLAPTAGMLSSYNWWAQSDVLRYAVALMRDEGSPLDANVTEADDVYLGMERHYDAPAPTVERFRWHANLDVELGHGSFPLEVFAQFPVIDHRRYAQLTKVARSIVELYDAVQDAVLKYYSAHDVSSRWTAETRDALAR